MKYIVYTDGAYDQNKKLAGLAYLIITDSEYINSASITLTGINGSTYVECISIGLALAYLHDNIKLTKDDVVEIHTDSKSAITFYEEHITHNSYIPSKYKQVVNSVHIARKIKSICSLTFDKVAAHKATLSPNVVVDRLSKLAVRRG